MPKSVLTGEAAVAITALVVKKNMHPKDIPLSDIRNELLSNGVYSLFYQGYNGTSCLNQP